MQEVQVSNLGSGVINLHVNVLVKLFIDCKGPRPVDSLHESKLQLRRGVQVLKYGHTVAMCVASLAAWVVRCV